MLRERAMQPRVYEVVVLPVGELLDLEANGFLTSAPFGDSVYLFLM